MARSLALHDEIPERASRPGPAIAAKGFRPFFALAAAYAILIVPLWLLVIAGTVRPSAYMDPSSWHAHEMILGFTVAVIAGFLLTAVGNWTKRETAVGVPLLGLAALWLAGRVAMLFASVLPRGLPALVDLAFVPLLMIVLARPLLAAKNHRNLVMLGILAALWAANVTMHLDALGIMAMGWAHRAGVVAVDVVALVMLLIAGRVFPMFTRNATGVASIRSIPVLDAMTVIGMAAVVVADALSVDATIGNTLAGLVGLLAAARAIHWGAQHSFKEPLLWILHAGYAWLVLGLVMRAAAPQLGISSSLATHAITVGAIGSLTLGMMARVSLGHT
ncbi:MAG: NnrS family protein, partial [Polyangiaceae bacterium]|nr:NnrS family protein [Polyangiaceae bacterium]